MRRPAPRLIGFRPLSVFTMELFTKLFGNLLAFVYHCFDRIVIHGYLSALSRPEQVVYFFGMLAGDIADRIVIANSGRARRNRPGHVGLPQARRARPHHSGRTPPTWPAEPHEYRPHHFEGVADLASQGTARLGGFKPRWGLFL